VLASENWRLWWSTCKSLIDILFLILNVSKWLNWFRSTLSPFSFPWLRLFTNYFYTCINWEFFSLNNLSLPNFSLLISYFNLVYLVIYNKIPYYCGNFSCCEKISLNIVITSASGLLQKTVLLKDMGSKIMWKDFQSIEK
jgi:hypothetical protein